MTTTVLLAIIELFGLFAVGWLTRRYDYIREEDLPRWSRFAVDILFPFLVLDVIIRDFQTEKLHELWPLPVIGFLLVALGALIGFPARRGLAADSPDVARTFHFFCAVNNYAFLPILIVGHVWGTTAVANLLFLNIGSMIGLWTIGITLLGGGSAEAVKNNALSPNVITLVAALVIAVAGLQSLIPDLVLGIVESLSHAAMPVILILIGARLYSASPRQHLRDLAYLSLLRLFVIPGLSILGLYALPLSADVRNVALVVALMPVPVSSVILTYRFGGCPEFASGAAVVTTLGSLVTVPLAVSLLAA